MNSTKKITNIEDFQKEIIDNYGSKTKEQPRDSLIKMYEQYVENYTIIYFNRKIIANYMTQILELATFFTKTNYMTEIPEIVTFFTKTKFLETYSDTTSKFDIIHQRIKDEIISEIENQYSKIYKIINELEKQYSKIYEIITKLENKNEELENKNEELITTANEILNPQQPSTPKPTQVFFHRSSKGFGGKRKRKTKRKTNKTNKQRNIK